MKKLFSLFLASCFVVFALISCTTVKNENVETLIIASETRDCTGVGRMKCLLVKENQNQEWQNFYSNIEGFTYEPGYEYELAIKKEKIENPAADQSSIKYILVKEISKTKKTSEGL